MNFNLRAKRIVDASVGLAPPLKAQADEDNASAGPRKHRATPAAKSKPRNQLVLIP